MGDKERAKKKKGRPPDEATRGALGGIPAGDVGAGDIVRRELNGPGETTERRPIQEPEEER